MCSQAAARARRAGPDSAPRAVAAPRAAAPRSTPAAARAAARAAHAPSCRSVQMNALPSWPAEARVDMGRPKLGAQATSRTQSASGGGGAGGQAHIRCGFEPAASAACGACSSEAAWSWHCTRRQASRRRGVGAVERRTERRGAPVWPVSVAPSCCHCRVCSLYVHTCSRAAAVRLAASHPTSGSGSTVCSTGRAARGCCRQQAHTACSAPHSSGCCFLSAAPLNQPSAPHISPALPLTLTQLSQPAEARRRTGCPGALEATSEPLGAAGDQETAVAPTGCAPSICGRSSGSGVQAGGSGRARLPPLPAGPTHASTPSCQHCIGPHCRSRWPAHASAHKPTTQPGL